MLSGWEVQQMKEADDARIWEELNAPDVFEKQMKDAAVDMEAAAGDLDKVINSIMEAAAELSETPMEDALIAILDEVEDVQFTIRKMAKNFEEGVRE